LIEFEFCPSCGTTLCWEIKTLSGFVVVAVGCFEDPKSLPAPVFSVYEARAHPWALKAVPEGAEHWD